MKLGRRVLLILFELGGFASLLLAADDNTVIYPGQSRAVTPPSGGGSESLLLIVGLLLAAGGAWFLWRGRRRSVEGGIPRSLQIAETRPLGNRQYLVVAAYENKKFLLGVCPDRIQLLAPLHDEPPEA